MRSLFSAICARYSPGISMNLLTIKSPPAQIVEAPMEQACFRSNGLFSKRRTWREQIHSRSAVNDLPFEAVLVQQFFRDLHRVERGAFEQLVAGNPETKAVVQRAIPADAPDLAIVPPGHIKPQWILGLL